MVSNLVIELADIGEVLARYGIVFTTSPLNAGLSVPAINLQGLIGMALFDGFGDSNADIEIIITIWPTTTVLRLLLRL